MNPVLDGRLLAQPAGKRKVPRRQREAAIAESDAVSGDLFFVACY
jgi:hypothetical protein